MEACKEAMRFGDMPCSHRFWPVEMSVFGAAFGAASMQVRVFIFVTLVCIVVCEM